MPARRFQSNDMVVLIHQTNIRREVSDAQWRSGDAQEKESEHGEASLHANSMNEPSTASSVICTTPDTRMFKRSNREAILDARAKINDAIARRDIDAFAALVTPWYSVVTARSLQRNGREESARSWAELFARDEHATHIAIPEELHINAEWGFAEELGKWRATIGLGEAPLEMSGVYAAKWHLTVAGWLLRAEMFTPMKVVRASAQLHEGQT